MAEIFTEKAMAKTSKTKMNEVDKDVAGVLLSFTEQEGERASTKVAMRAAKEKNKCNKKPLAM